MPRFRVTVPSGKSATLVARDAMQARQIVAKQIAQRGRMSYGQAWRVMSPGNPKVKVEKISVGD